MSSSLLYLKTEMVFFINEISGFLCAVEDAIYAALDAVVGQLVYILYTRNLSEVARVKAMTWRQNRTLNVIGYEFLIPSNSMGLEIGLQSRLRVYRNAIEF